MPEPAPNDSALNTRNNLFSEGDALRDLDALIATARSHSATKLLVLAGKPIVCRVDGQLSDPLAPGRVHFNQTERLVGALLSDEQHATLDRDGEIEFDYTSPTTATVNINIFFGDGAHNLVVFLE